VQKFLLAAAMALVLGFAPAQAQSNPQILERIVQIQEENLKALKEITAELKDHGRRLDALERGRPSYPTVRSTPSYEPPPSYRPSYTPSRPSYSQPAGNYISTGSPGYNPSGGCRRVIVTPLGNGCYRVCVIQSFEDDDDE